MINGHVDILISNLTEISTFAFFAAIVQRFHFGVGLGGAFSHFDHAFLRAIAECLNYSD